MRPVTDAPDRDELVAGSESTRWRRVQRRLLAGADLTPLRIALVYTVVGFGALIASDILLARYVSEPLLTRIQTLKGVVEIVLTAALILALTSGRELQLQGALARLDRQNARLQVLYRVFRHDLRNDLNVIQGYAEHLQAAVGSAATRESFNGIFRTVQKIERYTEQVHRIRQIDGDERSFELAETIQRVSDAHPLVTSDVELSVRVPHDVSIVSDRLFELALSELLTNAIKHNDAERPRVRVTVRPTEGASETVEVRVADDGPGIPETEREALHSGSEDQLRHLSGLGLWFVTWTAEYSGGDLRIEDNEWGGSTVVYRAPRSARPVLPSTSRATES
jgi:signal transduction histidine kinase